MMKFEYRFGLGALVLVLIVATFFFVFGGDSRARYNSPEREHLKHVVRIGEAIHSFIRHEDFDYAVEMANSHDVPSVRDAVFLEILALKEVLSYKWFNSPLTSEGLLTMPYRDNVEVIGSSPNLKWSRFYSLSDEIYTEPFEVPVFVVESKFGEYLY
jgi:hypothetical protein